MKGAKLIAGLLLVIAAGAAAWWLGPGGDQPASGPESKPEASGPVRVVKIYFGSEKKGLLADPDFQTILRDRYRLEVDGAKMGSLEMATGPVDAVDGIWPSSELAALVFKDRHPDVRYKSHNAFSTPIVFYSWPEIIQALIEAGVVEKRDNAYYVVKMKGYLDMVVAKTPWSDLGLPRQNGYVDIHSTDPRKSNSGFLLAGLMMVILNNGEVVAPDAAGPYLETIKEVYTRMGYLENSTGTLFDKYVKQGQGAFPLISAYESLIIEFYRAYPDYRSQIRERMRVLIPEPTVWSEHPFIALNDKGEALLEALGDPEVQKIAWDRYGFRSGVMGIDHDPAILEEIGLPDRIEVVAPLPSPEVMDMVLEVLSR
jgi:hypothetical protein